MGELDVKQAAQDEAERTFEIFMKITKYTCYVIVFGLVVVVVGCNSGVETGPNKTGSGYNGAQYEPYNLNVKDNK